jgi:dephospho-CoA kinase
VSGAAPGTRTVRIGITGPIGCGKSQVARWLGEAGARVIDADRVARDVTAPGTAVEATVLGRFGDGVRAGDGSLDRAALGRIVFADPAALKELEAIVHPATRPVIVRAIEAAEEAGARAVVIEAIKLVEGGLGELCDEIWLVTCTPETQRERIIGRGAPAEVAEQRIAAQAGLAERLRPSATRVLDTSGSAADVRTAVVAALDEAVAARR